MGWTGFSCETKGKSYHELLETYEPDFLRGWSNGKTKVTCLKSAIVKSILYTAMRTEFDAETNPPDATYSGNPYVWAMVVKMEKQKDEFLYKDMGETMGPAYTDCPPNILKLLTPTTNEYALQWRKSCFANAMKKKEDKILHTNVIGTKIRITSGICTGTVFTRLPYKGRLVWRNECMKATPAAIKSHGYEEIE